MTAYGVATCSRYLYRKNKCCVVYELKLVYELKQVWTTTVEACIASVISEVEKPRCAHQRARREAIGFRVQSMVALHIYVFRCIQYVSIYFFICLS